MSDPRLTPANDRVAAPALRGQMQHANFNAGAARRVCTPVADLSRAPGSERTRQLLMGAPVTCFEIHEGWAFVQAEDGYVGYLTEGAIEEASEPTHWVHVRASHAYNGADLKSPENVWRSAICRACGSHPRRAHGRRRRSAIFRRSTLARCRWARQIL